MIFVVLGTQKFQLNRLLRLVDQYVKEGLFKEEVFAQIGNSYYEPENYSYCRFLDKSEFDSCVKRASVVISHSGVGTIISALCARKPVIIFPRLEKYKEHVDNHQLDIAKAFAKKKYVICCYEEDSLIGLLEESRTFSFEEYVSQTDNIVSLINGYLDL